METKKFKTNAKCDGCVAKIGEKLNKEPKIVNWSLDLNTSDKVLTVETLLPSETIIKEVNEAGYKAEEIR